MEPLARERIWLSSDVGTARHASLMMSPCNLACCAAASRLHGVLWKLAHQPATGLLHKIDVMIHVYLDFSRRLHAPGCIRLHHFLLLSRWPVSVRCSDAEVAVRRRSELEKAWPGHEFSGLEEVWWTTDDPSSPRSICPESAGQLPLLLLLQRLMLLRPVSSMHTGLIVGMMV